MGGAYKGNFLGYMMLIKENNKGLREMPFKIHGYNNTIFSWDFFRKKLIVITLIKKGKKKEKQIFI